MHSRAHIEETITNRLLKDKPGDRVITAHEFREVANRLDVVFYRVLSETEIAGFTDEDLVSFMLMKTHQMLKQDRVDLDRKNWFTLFYRAFKNLMVDIVRMQESAHRRGMWLDALDTKADEHLEEDKLEPHIIATYTLATFELNV